MNFRPRRQDQPDLNLIPMIDVLIVLLIFLVLTTTFRHESALKIKLPESSAQGSSSDRGIEVSIDDASRLEVNRLAVEGGAPDALREVLAEVAGERRDVPLVIRADGHAPHQTVMTVLDVASKLGFTRIHFATREPEHAP